MVVMAQNMTPAFDSLCFFCPALRPRSRHPIKRYKRLLADIFPRSPDEQPNDRKIAKLCEYASKNPLRIPRITSSLEQRCYKDLRSEQLHSVKVVVCIYRKLLMSCKEQMPLFASSLLSIIQILLDQTRHDELRVLGCEALFDFLNNQKDGTYLFNLDSLIPKLCLLVQEVGDDGRVQHLRAVGLQALSSMVWFMGEFSHISADFDNIVSVTLENYEGQKSRSDALSCDAQNGCVEENSLPDSIMRVPSWGRIVGEKGEVDMSLDNCNNPTFWSRVCLKNMAQLAKEATTTRRVLESLFRYFDDGDLWSPQHGLALSVLMDMQKIIEKSGQSTHFVLTILIKHLDHKNVLKNPNMQLDIVDVATNLAQQTKVQPSVAIIGALSDMIRHLRKSIHCSLDDSSLGMEVIEWNRKFREAVDECVVQLSHKVGDADPILDVMAVMLENMPNITVMARTLISAVYRTAQIVASLPNLSYQNKAFPEALFRQLLLAMVFEDYETRIGAHRIFSIVLVPCSVRPRPRAAASISKKANDMQRTLSRTVSVFSSSAALFRKLKREECSSDKIIHEDREDNTKEVEDSKINNPSILDRLKSTSTRTYSVKRHPSLSLSALDDLVSHSTKEQIVSLSLSSRQITLLLSSIWVQSLSNQNTPENYEAIAHTYSLVLLFARTKHSSNETLIRSFQLAFSLRSFALRGKGSLQPSRRRSLFTLAITMIIFSSKAYNIVPLISSAKALMTDKTVDPFLRLIDDCKLEAVHFEQDQPRNVYGTKEDDEDALKSLSAIEITESQSKESYASVIVKFLGKSADATPMQESAVRQQLLKDFTPDDVCPLGADLFMDMPEQVCNVKQKDVEFSDNAHPPLFAIDDDVIPSTCEGQTNRDMQLAPETPGLLSVGELLDALTESTHQVGRLSVSAPTDMPYMEMAGHCEALSLEKQQKMSALMIAHRSQESFVGISACKSEQSKLLSADFHIEKSGNPFIDQQDPINLQNPFTNAGPMLCSAEYQHHQHFQLPASSPYDHFLKAAGC